MLPATKYLQPMELKAMLQLIWWNQKWKPLIIPKYCGESIDLGRGDWIFESPRGMLQPLLRQQLSCMQQKIQKILRQKEKIRAVVRLYLLCRTYEALLLLIICLLWTTDYFAFCYFFLFFFVKRVMKNSLCPLHWRKFKSKNVMHFMSLF